jgi:hypothetical protein
MVRSKAQDAEPGTVTVDQLAFGLAALDCSIWESPGAVWRAMEHAERDRYLAQARFVLGVAESTPDVQFSVKSGWVPDPLPPGAWGRTPGPTPNEVVVSGQIVPGRLESEDEARRRQAVDES